MAEAFSVSVQIGLMKSLNMMAKYCPFSVGGARLFVRILSAACYVGEEDCPAQWPQEG